MSKYTKFILVICLQAVVIFAIIVFKLAVLGTGTEVLLKIRPVDPRDPLRGDYVTFTYDISEVNYVPINNEFVQVGDEVYVLLRKSGNQWIESDARKTKPADSDTIFIKGRVTSVRGNVSNPSLIPKGSFNLNSMQSTLTVEYGIEEYFIPEGTGSGMRFGNNAAARVVVDENGNAVLKGLLIGGLPWP